MNLSVTGRGGRRGNSRGGGGECEGRGIFLALGEWRDVVSNKVFCPMARYEGGGGAISTMHYLEVLLLVFFSAGFVGFVGLCWCANWEGMWWVVRKKGRETRRKMIERAATELFEGGGGGWQRAGGKEIQRTLLSSLALPSSSRLSFRSPILYAKKMKKEPHTHTPHYRCVRCSYSGLIVNSSRFFCSYFFSPPPKTYLSVALFTPEARFFGKGTDSGCACVHGVGGWVGEVSTKMCQRTNKLMYCIVALFFNFFLPFRFFCK